ncbi:AsmA-like C-terminal region-containing protein [Acidobacteria bacterium AH-259-D05]|nr:AsmA-like C-terminal region-containing protein [Acidobacteria bacterium AH-259-D05]
MNHQRGGSTFDVTLSQFSISDGEISMLSSRGEMLTQIRGLALNSSVSFVEDRLSAVGTLSLETLNLGDSLFVRSLSAPVTISPEELKLSPISGKLAEGDFSGDIVLSTAGNFRYLLDIQVKEADVSTLLREAEVASRMNGKLQASVQVEGRGGVSTMVGKGRASVVGGKLAQLPAQDLLATLLQVASLREIEFDECLVEFILADNILETPVIRLISPLVQVTGKGSISLEQNTLDHDMTLALSKEVLPVLPAPLLGAFNQRVDGFYSLDFRLWGPFNSPKMDIQQRLVKGAAQELLEKGLEGLKNLFR